MCGGRLHPCIASSLIGAKGLGCDVLQAGKLGSGRTERLHDIGIRSCSREVCTSWYGVGDIAVQRWR